MRKLKKFHLTAIVSLLLCFLVCLSAAFFLLAPAKTAEAARNSEQFTEIGGEDNDLYIDGQNMFDGNLLQALYKALGGVENYTQLSQKVGSGTLTSADFRNQNSGKNVSVWFGGKKWDAVYLIKDNDGNLALDLWQSADNISETLSKYANRTNTSNNYNDEFPDNMYSTSLIRVETLNNGGYISESGSALAQEDGEPKLYSPKTSDKEEDKDTDNYNTYARFTSSEAENSLVAYLLKPNQVGYQETESAFTSSNETYNCVNDAYGSPPKIIGMLPVISMKAKAPLTQKANTKHGKRTICGFRRLPKQAVATVPAETVCGKPTSL